MTLAEKYRVSRSAIREAVKILVGKGLPAVRREIGTKVRNRRMASVSTSKSKILDATS